MIVTSVQIKTAKTQKHLYCPVFTKKFRNLWISELFCAFCGTLESAEKVMHNATITAVKKVRKLGFEKVTFCNFFGERFCTHAEFLWPVAP